MQQELSSWVPWALAPLADLGDAFAGNHFAALPVRGRAGGRRCGSPPPARPLYPYFQVCRTNTKAYPRWPSDERTESVSVSPHICYNELKLHGGNESTVT